MKLYVTSLCGSLWEVDASTSKVIRHDLPADDRVFGITWSPAHLFLARPDRIEVYDHSLQYLNSLQQGVWGDLHQISWRNSLWATCPRLNCVTEWTDHCRFFKPVEGEWSAEAPSPITSEMRYVTGGAYHYNSLLFYSGHLYLMANNNSFPSFVLKFDMSSMELVQKWENVGREAHNLCVIGEELFYLDSRGKRAIMSDQGFVVSLYQDDRHFIRGLATTASHFFVGGFPFRKDRGERRTGDSTLFIVRRDGLVEDRITLKGSGDICDVRCIDEFDYSHRVRPLQPKEYL